MNVLAIGAHFDDIELGCGGTIARHLAKDDNVFVYIATLSGYKSPDGLVVRDNETALQEGFAALTVLGIKKQNLMCGQFKTFEVEFVDELTRQLVKILEQKQIDIVYTHWIGDTHHDHLAVSRSSLHACRHIPRVLMYRSNWYDSPDNFQGNFYVDISDYWQKKESAIAAHESEMKRTGSQWISYFKYEAENAGRRIGVKYAEVFELVKWLETITSVSLAMRF
jgi:LmbE family N-acetylglucosaminyl deacetylase